MTRPNLQDLDELETILARVSVALAQAETAGVDATVARGHLEELRLEAAKVRAQLADVDSCGALMRQMDEEGMITRHVCGLAGPVTIAGVHECADCDLTWTGGSGHQPNPESFAGKRRVSPDS